MIFHDSSPVLNIRRGQFNVNGGPVWYWVKGQFSLNWPCSELAVARLDLWLAAAQAAHPESPEEVPGQNQNAVCVVVVECIQLSSVGHE